MNLITTRTVHQDVHLIMQLPTSRIVAVNLETIWYLAGAGLMHQTTKVFKGLEPGWKLNGSLQSRYVGTSQGSFTVSMLFDTFVCDRLPWSSPAPDAVSTCLT